MVPVTGSLVEIHNFYSLFDIVNYPKFVKLPETTLEPQSFLVVILMLGH